METPYRRETALEFATTNILWTLEMNFKEDSPVFTLELGFNKTKDPKWKSFQHIVVININVTEDTIFLDVVNSLNNVFGVIIMKVEDRMTLCTDQMLKNQKAVPKAFRLLMDDIKTSCEQNNSDLITVGKLMSLYMTRANALATRILTDLRNE